MKIQTDKPTLEHVKVFCEMAQHIQWGDKILTAMVHEQLALLQELCERKLKLPEPVHGLVKALPSIKKNKAQRAKPITIEISYAQALAVQTVLPLMELPRRLVVAKYFMEPVNKSFLAINSIQK